MLLASLRGLLARKLRLVLAVVAIVISVAFLSGALIIGDSVAARFGSMFDTVNKDVDVRIEAVDTSAKEPPLLTDQDLAGLGRVAGVASVTGEISVSGVVPFDVRGGTPVTTSGVDQLGLGVAGDDALRPVELADGRWPTTEGEVSLTRFTADKVHADVGDRVRVYLPLIHDSREFTVVGINVFRGGRASLAGETVVVLPRAEAQRQLLGATGKYSGAALHAAAKVSQEQLRDRVAAVTPPGFEAKTGKQANADHANQVQASLSQLTTYVFGPFALLALIVGGVLIFNTFNIVVVQRTEELALLRALGASRRQVAGSVLLEAVLLGAAGATIGLLGGVGLAAVGVAQLGAAGREVPGGSISVGPAAVVAAYVVGVLVTVAAAAIPAVRASALPPVAVMRAADRPNRSLRWPAIIGAVLAVPGALLLAAALARSSDTGDDFVLPGMFGGAVLLFLGASLLSPLLTRPLAGLIGRALSWGVSGRLGVRNVLRSPRRTAVTAAPLMIGVTLVGAASVVAQSFTVSIHHAVNETLGARVIVQTDLQGVPGETGFAESAADRVRRVPGVKTFLPLWVSRKTHARGATAPFGGTFATDDLATVRSMFNLAPTAGTLDRLGAGEFATDDTTARTRGWHVGDTVGLVSDVGEERQYRLIGLYKATPIWTDTMILPKAAVVDFAGPLAYQGYVRVDDGADVAAVRRQVEQIMRQYPLVTVGDLDDLLKQYTGAINAVLTVVTLLLLVTILVALLGIINTLLLSTYERIRELGVLRAVGLTRGGTRLMVSIESVVLALFGCVLGVVLGVGLGLALSAALVKRDFLSVIAVPWGTLVTFIILAVVAGVLASLWPAARASRLNLLRALAHE